MFNLIVAIGNNNEIGKDNKLLWNIPEDLKKFKEITTGNIVIMGRKTYESIGRPLPNRENIILTRNKKKFLEKNKNLNVEVYENIETLIEKYKNNNKDIFIIGGEEIYKIAMEKDIIKKLYISHINYEDKEADAYFPKIDYKKWKKTTEEKYEGRIFCIYEKGEVV